MERKRKPGRRTPRPSHPGRLISLVDVSPSALDAAQDLIREAWQLPVRRERIRRAKRALKLCADCADAYLLLAEETSDPGVRVDLLRQAVQAGNRALGRDARRRYAGAFWGAIRTRPYMRALAALAGACWDLGERDGAIRHYQTLLRLNPNDNQGIRFVLIDCLVAEGRDQAALRLLRRYPGDPTAAWAYSWALVIFRLEGPGPRARQFLEAARHRNPFVTDYLKDLLPVSQPLPASIGLGDASEAMEYAERARTCWEETPYALDWLDDTSRANSAAGGTKKGAGA